MASFVIYDLATGRVRGCEDYPDDSTPKPGDGWGILPIQNRLDPGRGDTVVNGAYVPYAPTLADNRAAKAASARQIFDGLIAAGFSYQSALYQIDAESQARIAAANVIALGSIADPANSPWPADFYWIAADNSHVPMSAQTICAFGRAVAGYIGGCILQLRTIKDAIAAAANQPALDAIDIAAGYPTATA